MKTSDPVTMLRETMLRQPDLSAKALFDVMKNNVSQSPIMFENVFRYWFTNHLRAFRVIEKSHERAVVKVTRKLKAKARATRTAVKKKLQMVLLDHMLSNGKLLRHATFADCAREGGWLSTVAKQGKPTEIVGNVMTETDLRNLQMRNAA